MQKVKMVDYAYTDPRSFKNTLLRDQAIIDWEAESENPAPKPTRSNSPQRLMFSVLWASVRGRLRRNTWIWHPR